MALQKCQQIRKTVEIVSSNSDTEIGKQNCETFSSNLVIQKRSNRTLLYPRFGFQFRLQAAMLYTPEMKLLWIRAKPFRIAFEPFRWNFPIIQVTSWRNPSIYAPFIIHRDGKFITYLTANNFDEYLAYQISTNEM